MLLQSLGAPDEAARIHHVSLWVEPITARAQQSAMPVVGFLSSASPASWAPFVAGFRKGLNETGLIEGQNMAIEYRWAEGDYHRLSGLVANQSQGRCNLGCRRKRAGTSSKSGDDAAGLQSCCRDFARATNRFIFCKSLVWLPSSLSVLVFESTPRRPHCSCRVPVRQR